MSVTGSNVLSTKDEIAAALAEEGMRVFAPVSYTHLELMDKYDLQLPLAESSVKYKLPAQYDDLLEIRSMVLELKNASVIMGYEIYNRDSGKLLVTGSTKHAFVDGTMTVSYTHLDVYKRQMPDK